MNKISTIITNGLLFIFLVALIASRPDLTSTIENKLIITFLAISIITMIIHFVYNHEVNYMRIDVIFIVGFLITNLQWPIMISVFGIFPKESSFLKVIEEYLTYITWMSTLALVSWSIGFNSYKNKNKNKNKNAYMSKKVIILAMMLFLIFISVAGSDYISGKIYKEAHENILSSVSGLAGYLLSILTLFPILILSYLFYRKTIKQPVTKELFQRKTELYSIIFISIYILFFAAVGERGEVLKVLVAASIVIGHRYKPIKLIYLLPSLIFGAFIFSYIGIYRSDNTISILDFIYSLNIYDLTINLANSIVATGYGLDAIAANNDLFYGQLWLSNILGLIPFAQSFLIKLTELSVYDIGSAAYITHFYFGDNPPSGLGTTLIIDIYMNFGQIGLIIIMFIYGVICKKMAFIIKNNNSNYTEFSIALIFSSLIFYINRGSLFIQLQPILWSLILILILFKNNSSTSNLTKK